MDNVDMTTIIAILALVISSLDLLLLWYFQIHKPERVAIQFEPKPSRNEKIARGNKFSGTIRVRNKGDYDTSITSITFISNSPHVRMAKLADNDGNDYLLNPAIHLPGGTLKVISYEVECGNPPTVCKNAMFMFDIPSRKRGTLEKKLTLHFL